MSWPSQLYFSGGLFGGMGIVLFDRGEPWGLYAILGGGLFVLGALVETIGDFEE